MNRQESMVIAISLSSLVLMQILSTSQAQAGPLPEDWYVDETLYPKAYGILASEKLMFPVDMSDWPVKIDDSHQLFVDDYLIASMDDVERQVHQARKHPDNPVMMAQHPWEGEGGNIMAIVRRDEKTGRFRMWYAGQLRYTLPSGISARYPALYAESPDGIHWTKPQLGLYAFQGSKANNIVIPAGNLFGLIIDPADPEPNRRYKGIVWHEPEYVPREGHFLYTSPDGIHWTRVRKEPLALHQHRYTMPQNGIGDTSLFRWDRLLGKYVGDVKFVLPGKFRCRGMMESDDLVHWTSPRMTLYPDALDNPDVQIYGHLSFCYESMWIGLVRVMHTDQGWKQTAVELTASRDGRHWTRVGRREECIPLGGPNDWDADYHEPMSEPIRVDNELWFFYRSCRSHKRGSGESYDAIGLAILRRDGFVSLNAAESPGTIVTRPLRFTGRRLFLNADVQDGGWIKVALLSPANEPIQNYALNDTIPVTEGAVEIPVTWRHFQAIELPAVRHIRLQFQLKRARLYAFWMK